MILLTGRLGYFLQNKISKCYQAYDLRHTEICRENIIKVPLQRSLLWSGLLHTRIPGAKTAMHLIFRCHLWKHLSHFINTPISLPFAVFFTKNKFLKYITGLKPPSHGDKCHSQKRAILILYSSCSVCLSKRSVQTAKFKNTTDYQNF